MGEASDQAKERGRQVAEEQYEKARAVAAEMTGTEPRAARPDGPEPAGDGALPLSDAGASERPGIRDAGPPQP